MQITTDLAPSMCLWFHDQALEAAELYTSLVPRSSIGEVSYYGENMPLPAGTPLMVPFTLGGVSMLALNGGPAYTHSPAFSITLNPETQAEVDYLWESLIAGGGQESQCGWLQDRFGVSWQIVPTALHRLMGGPDAEGAARATQAMLGMVKLDIAALQAAYDGDA